MKFNQLSIIITGCIIGVSFIVGCTILANNEGQLTEQTAVEIYTDKPLLGIEQAAEYLNLSVEQVNLIINSEQNQLQSSGSFSGTMFPYFNIGSAIYISKSDLVNWISDTTRERREYVGGSVLQ